MIYLDHNATTPLDEEVKEAMADAFHIFGNPSSGHGIGRSAKAIIENARQKVADLIGASPHEIIFTSCGTEANNLAIIGTAYRHKKGHIITSVIEHPSVLNPVKWLEQNGFSVTCLPVATDGRVSPDDVRKALRNDTILITVMHANNETGVLQPVRDIGRIAREHDVVFHSDAAQSVAKIDLNVKDLVVDMLTIVPHKFYGPKGTGALYLRDGTGLMPVLFGAGHERGMRPGTENVIGICGMGKACETAGRDMFFRRDHSAEMRDAFFGLLKSSLDIRLNGNEVFRLPNTLNISIKGIVGEDLVNALNDRVAFSSGSACHSGLRCASAVLKAMGLTDSDALSAVRLSVGKDNTPAEIEAAAQSIIEHVTNRPSIVQ